MLTSADRRDRWRKKLANIDDRTAEDDELTAAKLQSLVIERYPELTVSVFSHVQSNASVGVLTTTATRGYYPRGPIGTHPQNY